jgi:hypothetical protein
MENIINKNCFSYIQTYGNGDNPNSLLMSIICDKNGLGYKQDKVNNFFTLSKLQQVNLNNN